MSDRLPGGYEIIRVLGKGSFGRTLLCSDERGERQVAVKELHFERRCAELFKDGEFGHGGIISAEGGPVYAIVKYEYEVSGQVYVAFMEYATEMTRYWGEGDTVPVLYDRDDPQHSCFVYR